MSRDRAVCAGGRTAHADLTCNMKGSTSMSQATRPDTTNLSRRTALAGLAGAAAAGITPVIAVAAEVDPIFTVIAEHRAANIGLYAECEATDVAIEDCPIKTAALERQEAAELPLFTTAPTTLFGAAALLEYLASPASDIGHDPDDYAGEMVDGVQPSLMSYSRLWLKEDLAMAVHQFQFHLAAALRAIAVQP